MAVGTDNATSNTGAKVISASVTRPANTTAYASGDLIANSTVAASVTPLTFAIGKSRTKNVLVRRARLTKDDDDLTAAVFRLHLFDASPVGTAPANGDNDALTGGLTDVLNNYLGSFDFDLTVQPDLHTDGNIGFAIPSYGNEIIANASGGSIFGLLEARAAYTPASEEVFTVYLELVAVD